MTVVQPQSNVPMAAGTQSSGYGALGSQSVTAHDSYLHAPLLISPPASKCALSIVCTAEAMLIEASHRQRLGCLNNKSVTVCQGWSRVCPQHINGQIGCR